MVYKIRWNEGKKILESKKTFKVKKNAEKKVRFFRQMDDDLPKSKRDKSLKTYRVIKVRKNK